MNVQKGTRRLGRKRVNRMIWAQYPMKLPPFPRGLHLITHEVTAAAEQLKDINQGLLNIFLQAYLGFDHDQRECGPRCATGYGGIAEPRGS